MRKKVIFDKDNTAGDWTGKAIGFLNSEFPELNATRDHVNTYDFWKQYPSHVGEALVDFIKRPGFFRTMELIPGAHEAFMALAQMGHEIIIVTTPHEGIEEACKREKEEWVEQHFGSEYVKTMKFSSKKNLEHADVIIDDNPKLTFRKRVINFNHWLIVDHPYNRILPRTRHRPIGRINSDWSNWRTEFENIDLI